MAVSFRPLGFFSISSQSDHSSLESFNEAEKLSPENDLTEIDGTSSAGSSPSSASSSDLNSRSPSVSPSSSDATTASIDDTFPPLLFPVSPPISPINSPLNSPASRCRGTSPIIATGRRVSVLTIDQSLDPKTVAKPTYPEKGSIKSLASLKQQIKALKKTGAIYSPEITPYRFLRTESIEEKIEPAEKIFESKIKKSVYRNLRQLGKAPEQRANIAKPPRPKKIKPSLSVPAEESFLGTVQSLFSQMDKLKSSKTTEG